MTYISRLIKDPVKRALQRGKSILLLGARQTGKTTFIKNEIKPALTYSFARASTRQRYEQNPALLEAEIEYQLSNLSEKQPLIFIDEVQKIPRVMDIAQDLIDNRKARFILSGSSARKLKSGKDINLLPGRVVSLKMMPFVYQELITLSSPPSLEDMLIYGTLPGIILEDDLAAREEDLYSYVSTYIEDEIRAEAVVRNVGSFSRFLEIAAGESGRQINYSKLSQDIGVADTTIANYFQILVDCLLVNRIDPIIKSATKRRLIKSPKYIFFDLGIRRSCANEGIKLPYNMLGNLFEQFIGNELIAFSENRTKHIKVKYWRDVDGPEVDYVLDYAGNFIPIEVKWTEKPNTSDIKHLIKFSQEYPNVEKSYIICRTPNPYEIANNIIALPWQSLNAIFENLE